MKLSASSALVLLWADAAALATPQARAFLARLDLSDGADLRAKCDAIWPHYAEIIRNRKFGVRHWLEQTLKATSDTTQLVLAGSGLDPLGLDMASLYAHCTVFELDRDNMARKAQLAADIENAPKQIRFVTADLADALSCRQALEMAGWQANTPSLLVLEGISYYLSPGALKALIQTIAPVQTLIECLIPAAAIAPARRAIPQQVFALIQKQFSLPSITRYRVSELRKLLEQPVEHQYTMAQLEQMRLGKNTHFFRPDSGWIALAGFRAP